MTEAGALVIWNPPNVYRIFPAETAFALLNRLPLKGIMKRVDGQIGLMSYIAPSGKKAEIPVRLDEVTEVHRDAE